MPDVVHGLRLLEVSPEFEGIALSEDGQTILCAPEYEAIAREWQYNPEFFSTMGELRRFIHGELERAKSRRVARLQIRQGLIQLLGGLEELWGLPRSIIPKRKA